MKKRAFCFALSMIVCFGVLALPEAALAACAPVQMEPSVETSIYSDSQMTRYAYILHASGELWLYNIDNEDLSKVTAAMVLDDVKAITSDSDASAITRIHALRNDGTLWECDGATSKRQLDRDVVQIAGFAYLKSDGKLYDRIDFADSPHALKAENVISIASVLGRLAYVTADGELVWGGRSYDGYSKVFSGASSIVGFALNSNGELYGFGDNTLGGVGNGGAYDGGNYAYAGTVQVGDIIEPTLTVVYPSFVMKNVTEMYFDYPRIYARDDSGTLWQWGDSPSRPTATVVSGNSFDHVQITDPLYYAPRKSAANEPSYRQINSVEIHADGTLWKTTDYWEDGERIYVNVQLPVNFSDVMNAAASTTPTQPVPEAPSSWAVEQVNAAIAAGIVPEALQSQYTAATTRAEFCALAVALYETAMGKEITGRSAFSDTTDVGVQKMASLGVVAGVGDNKFSPDSSLTREQAATMLSRLAGAMNKPMPEQAPTFADNGSIGSWAYDAVGHVQAAGIMGGVGNNQFSPSADYTREQSIVTMLRLFDYVK